MKLWHYHCLSLLLGLIVMALCSRILPIIFFFFVLFGDYISLFVVAYITGRFVLSHAMPGTYGKIRESRCQRPQDVA